MHQATQLSGFYPSLNYIFTDEIILFKQKPGCTRADFHISAMEDTYKLISDKITFPMD